jgi:CheY-like chemotaxis protein
MKAKPNRRILVVDDMPAIHEDFRRVFDSKAGADLSAYESVLFGESETPERDPFEVDFASQGQEALDKVIEARRAGHPYALAIVDMRMPPGWDGVETVTRLWQVDRDLGVVICTAYSDMSVDEIRRRLGAGDRLAMLRKPFDAPQALEQAESLIAQWNGAQQ